MPHQGRILVLKDLDNHFPPYQLLYF